MKIRTSILVSIVLFIALASVNAQEGCVTVRVTDESGQVVSNALVSAGFATNIKPGWGWGGGKPNSVKGYTDTNGVCSLKGDGNGGEVAVSVKKDGYYGSGGYSVVFTNATGIALKKWEPRNQVVQVALKKIGKPIPMYAKWIRDMTIPAEGKALGFDLEKGDWGQPAGKGEHADLLFRLDREPEREVMRYWGNQPRPQKLYDVTLSVSLPTDGDGIQSVLVPPRGGRSNLRLSAKAPESGYVTNVIKRIYNAENKPPHSDVREDQNYFFRVRTKKDEKGNIVSALYGKIHGDFSGFDYGKLTFTYYLNPTPNDRNVEFDPKQNLFKNPSPLEEVRAP